MELYHLPPSDYVSKMDVRHMVQSNSILKMELRCVLAIQL